MAVVPSSSEPTSPPAILCTLIFSLMGTWTATTQRDLLSSMQRRHSPAKPTADFPSAFGVAAPA
jgi:hypothetical protein